MTLKMPFTIEIPRRAGSCAKLEEKFTPGMDYYSVIKEEDEQYVRSDYCPNCWEQVVKTDLSNQQFIHWKSKVPLKEKGIELSKNRDERALELLKMTIEHDTPESIEDGVVLALYLARKRLITLRQQIEQEGRTVNLYEVAETEEMLTVKWLDLFKLKVSDIQDRLVQRFKD